MTMSDTAMPTMKVDALYNVPDWTGFEGSAPLTRKIGIQSAHVVHQRHQGALDRCRGHLGDEERQPERHGYGDPYGDHGDQDGVHHDAEDPEVVDVRLPGLGGQEGELGHPERGLGPYGQEDPDEGEDDRGDGHPGY